MGISESIIGRWLISRGCRDEVVIGSKVGYYALPYIGGIRPSVIAGQIDKSLRRLQTDHIDLYYAHRDDDGDLTDTLAAFDELIQKGKIRAYGLSNFSAARIREAVEICNREGLPRPAAVQANYSLVERAFESDARHAIDAAQVPLIAYRVLAQGFLTGKYRDQRTVDSVRASYAQSYLNDPRGPALLAALDEIAEPRGVAVASVAIAWVRQQPFVGATMTSARTVEQLAPMTESLQVELSVDELERLRQTSSARGQGGQSW